MKKNAEKKQLTEEFLASYNALPAKPSNNVEMEDISNNAEQQALSQFAENLKQNYPTIFSVFENILKRNHETKGNWKVMNVIIEGVTETIITQKLAVIPVSYFGAFLSGLSSETTPSKTSSFLQLLCVLSDHITDKIFQAKIDYISNILSFIQRNFEKAENVVMYLIPFMIQCLAKVQGFNSTKKNELATLALNYLTDSRTKLREKCLFNIQHFSKQLHIDDSIILSLVDKYINNRYSVEITINLLKGITSLTEHLKQTTAVTISQKFLEVMIKNSFKLPIPISIEIFRLFKSIFKSVNIGSENIASLIDIFTEKFLPGITDKEDAKRSVAFIEMLIHAHKRLHKFDPTSSSTRLARLFKTLVEVLFIKECDVEEVVSVTFSGLQRLIISSFDLNLFPDEDKVMGNEDEDMEVEEGGEGTQSPMLIIANTLQKGLEKVEGKRFDLIAQLVHSLIIKLGILKRTGQKPTVIYNCVSDFLLFSSDVYEEILQKEKEEANDLPVFRKAELKHSRAAFYLEKIIAHCMRVIGTKAAIDQVKFDGWVLSILINQKIDISPLTQLKSLKEELQLANNTDIPKMTGVCVNDNLSYWIEFFLPLSNKFFETSKSTEDDRFGNNVYRTLYVETFSLLSQYCSYALDLETQFPLVAPLIAEKLTQSTVNKASDNKLKIVGCHSIELAIKTLMHVYENDGKLPTMIYGLDKNSAKRGLDVIAGLASNFLPILFNLYVEQNASTTTLDLQTAAADAITSLCKIIDENTIVDYFKQVLKKILTTNTDTEEGKFFGFFDLALTMLKVVPNSCLELFYKFNLPYLKLTQNVSKKLQKRAYKGIYVFLDRWNRTSTIMKPETINEILGVFESILQVTITKKFRVKCFLALAEKYHDMILNNPHSNFIIGECIYNYVNAENQKVKDLTVKIFKVLIDPLTNNETFGPTQQQANVIDFVIRKVMPGLCAKGNDMIAATIEVLSELMSMYSKYLSPILKDVFDSVSITLEDENTKVVSALIHFFKKCVSLFDKQVLKPYLPSYLETFFKHSNEKSKGSSLRIQLKFLFSKLLKKFTVDELKAVVPNKEHQHFIRNTFKQMERLKRKSNDKSKKKDEEEEMKDEKEEQIGSAFDVKKGKLVIEKLPEDGNNDETNKKPEQSQRTVDLIKQSIASGRKKKRDELNADQKYLKRLETRKNPKEKKIIFGGSGKTKVDPYAYIPLDPKRLNKRERNKESTFKRFERITKKKH
ncbi:hypothetical protein ABK040_015677 [Willaertia magna]